MKSRSGETIKLTSIDELLGVVNEESAMEIEINRIHAFKNHPFKVLDDEKMADLIESVKSNGVLTPVLLRSDGEDGYEMISGHRRMHAAAIAGLETIPAIVRELSDDDAVIAMVDANIQREELLPSEKGFAYKMKLDAIKRQGKRVDLTCGHNGHKLGKKSREELGEQVGESARNVQRYIRLTELIPELLDICEARFSNNSYGFRPNRSVENAIAATYRLMQKSGLHYVVEFDIKGFFDNVDHSKLIKQLWSLNIRDKELLYVIRRILKAPILMPDGHTEHPTKGTPQGGIISPLLANVVLNELDHWIESQWQCNPVTENYAYRENAAGCPIQSHAYRAMRNTRLKEMYIVRYADDFRILCRTREQADRTLIAVTQWLKERLRLDVSPEKTRVVDVRRSYSEFLGFKIRLRKKGKKYVVQSHMCDKAYKKVKASLTKQVGNIKFPRKGRGEAGEVRLFNSMVMGIQNYYQLATDISIDCGDIGRTVNTVLKNRLKSGKTHRLKKEGRDLTKMEIQRYGKSEQLRYIAQSKEPIYPISYVQCKNPMSQRRKVCAYTAAGRSEIHDDLRINTFLLLQLMRAPTYSRSTEYADNRISLFSAQWGKCAVTGKKFQCISEIHCHHKKPKGIGGSDKYENLVLVLAPVHELIHAVDEDTIRSYLTALKLDTSQLTKLNKLRTLAKRKPIDLEKPNLTNNSHTGERYGQYHAKPGNRSRRIIYQ